MKCFCRYLFLFSFLALKSDIKGQDNPGFRFGKVTKADFYVQLPISDSDAHAIIVGDIGKTIIRPNNRGSYNYEFYRRMRVKIVDLNGVKAGQFLLPIYLAHGSSAREAVTSLKAITYNFDRGRIIETKLENDQVFTEKQNSYVYFKKFSLPALKAGSIFEIAYKIESDFLYNFRPWEFQHEYPCMWSEYETEIPERFNYDIFPKGDIPYTIHSNKKDARSFNIAGNYITEDLDNMATVSLIVNVNRWVIVNVPPLKEETFIRSGENFRNKIEFQRNFIRLPEDVPRVAFQLWKKVAKELLEYDEFGGFLEKKNNWLEAELKLTAKGNFDTLETAKKIYAFIRDHFKATKRNSIFMATDIKELLKTKRGNIADINLLLIAALKYEKIKCYPIILSTRENGIPNYRYPVLSDYNYVLCGLVINNSRYFLDASIPDLPFGKIDLKCYNGEAKEVTEEVKSIDLSADSIADKCTTFAALINEKEKMKGRVSVNMGSIQSILTRRILHEDGEKKIVNELARFYGEQYAISELNFDSLSRIDDPVTMTYNIDFNHGGKDIFYFSPVLVKFYEENPFHSVQRKYPVEMPCKIDKTFILNMSIPDGYALEELPKSLTVKLNEKDGIFDYIISSEDGTIHLKTRITLYKANFQPQDYEGLRSFFSYVLQKQAEQIVFKKILK
jgi:Domain of Unknown Function with PDB structure (DUF3858)/Domain of Unknown Function with PDB structure (DUF3857)